MSESDDYIDWAKRAESMPKQDFEPWEHYGEGQRYCTQCNCIVSNDSPGWMACYHTTARINATYPPEWKLITELGVKL